MRENEGAIDFTKRFTKEIQTFNIKNASLG